MIYIYIHIYIYIYISMYPDCPLIEIIDFGLVDFWARSSAFLWSPWHHRCGSMWKGGRIESLRWQVVEGQSKYTKHMGKKTRKSVENVWKSLWKLMDIHGILTKRTLKFMDFAGDISGCFRILLHQFLSNWTIPLLTNCFTIRPSNFRGFPFATFNYRRVHTRTHTYIYI